MKIWVDADACPKGTKALVFRVSRRLNVPVVLVANRAIEVPRSPQVSLVVVGRGLDEADRHIETHCAVGDLVITADIPLAAALVGKGVATIDPRGTVYTANNVHDALATRDLMQNLREEGIMQGGLRPFGQKERESFANAIDRELTRLRRKAGAGP